MLELTILESLLRGFCHLDGTRFPGLRDGHCEAKGIFCPLTSCGSLVGRGNGYPWGSTMLRSLQGSPIAWPSVFGPHIAVVLSSLKRLTSTQTRP